jgi:hypothetical protein
MPKQLWMETERLARIIEDHQKDERSYGRASARSSEIELVILMELIIGKHLLYRGLCASTLHGSVLHLVSLAVRWPDLKALLLP